MSERDPKERVAVRKAARNHRCWSFSERCDPPHVDGVGDCLRLIAKGEVHVVSTIYPGHDSGYADGGWDRHGKPIPPRPVTSHFCMNCSHRWRNLRAALNGTGEEAT